MTMKIKILGCGSSGGVPLISGNWGACDPNNPKNHRTRSSIVVQVDGQNILIDTSPDLRQQLLRASINTIDAVILTHAHADHLHGIDELRHIFFHQKKKIPIYADGKTLEKVLHAFSYMFQPTDSFYPAFLEAHPIESETINIGKTTIHIFDQEHGHQRSSGIKIGNMAYSTDVKSFPERSKKYLHNLDLWIVDCLRYEPHHTHAHFDITMGWIEGFKPKIAILTHLSEQMDFEELTKKLPTPVEVAFDTMEVVL